MVKKIKERLSATWPRLLLEFLILIVFVCHAAYVFRIASLDQLESFAYDERLKFSMAESVDKRIVIVDIDEASLQEVGRWPWSRDVLAVLLEQLFEKYMASIVGFDVVFAEPDDSSGLKVLEALAQGKFKNNEQFLAELDSIRPGLDYDELFAAKMGNYPVILGYYFTLSESVASSIKSGQLPPPIPDSPKFIERTVKLIEATGHGGNLAAFQEVALGGGHFSQQPDIDGIVRRVPLLVSYQDGVYTSLALEIARWVLGGEAIQPVFASSPGELQGYTGLEAIKLGHRRIPVDQHVRMQVPFRGKQGSFDYVSARAILAGEAHLESLKNKIVLVGTTAPGLLDMRSVPMQELYPGVEVSANIISAILDERYLSAPEYVIGLEVLVLSFLGLCFLFFGLLLSPLGMSTYIFLSVALVIALNQYAWVNLGLVVPLASCLLMMSLMYLAHMSYGYFVESRNKRHLAGLFGQYVPPELVDEMALSPKNYSLEAENRELTVLFSDIRGFTTLSEGLPPRELSQLMNEFLTPMTHIIHHARGTIDKYMGDAILAFWGAPIPDSAHATNALEAALKMLKSVDEVNTKFRQHGWPEIRIGVGINTGSMSVGNMGSEFRMAYTVLGDSVNLGSRLEGLTKNYGVDLICSEYTMSHASQFSYRELDRVRVKGKNEPVTIYEPLCLTSELTPELKREIGVYGEGLKFYRSERWRDAEECFSELQKSSGSSYIYKMYFDRIQHFKSNPPAVGWGGVFDHKTK